LGEVVVRVSMDEGVMQAKIDVQTPQVKSILEGNLPQLREQLMTKNIEIPRIEIVAEMQTSLQNAAGQSGARQRQEGGKRTVSDEPFQEAEESLRAMGYNTIEMTI
ncbi:MAG: flagellar hook-length control protein FliK, partial [Bacteroidetes bacterium]|nr:flagellar hook-length control protein FliK [Bacteroidota bacterium]